MLKIKNIIFDFGGVIIDIEPNAIIEKLKNINFSNFQKLLEPEFKDILEQFERGIIKASTFRNSVCSYLDLKLTDQAFDDVWNAMLYDIPTRRIELVKQLKQHYHVYLMSNSNEIHYDLFVRDLQLRFGYHEFDNLFDKAFFSFDLHLLKPNPDFYTYVLDHYNMNPAETLFIDDTKENIVGAQNLGIQTYHILRGSRVVDLFENGILKKDLKLNVFATE